MMLVAAAAATAALLAVTFSSSRSPAASRTAQVSSGATQTPRTQGAVAVRDPNTGQLRDATPDELLQLQGLGVAGSVTVPIVSAQGFDGLRLGDDQMSFTVATRNADGSIGVAHATGKKEADQLVKGGMVVSKERINER
jgi:hypothetical protein